MNTSRNFINLDTLKQLPFLVLGVSVFFASQLRGSAQTVLNGDFSANGADFTSANGEAGAGTNPTSITDFAHTGAASFGIGSPSGSPDSNTFAPEASANHGSTIDSSIAYFAFIQDMGTLTGSVTGLTPGDTYELSFDGGQRRDPGHANGSASVTLSNATGAGSDISYSTLNFGNGSGFNAYSGDFVATSTDSVITLTNSATDSSQDFANLAVTFVSGPSTPEPGTFALVGLGVLALFVITRRTAIRL